MVVRSSGVVTTPGNQNEKTLTEACFLRCKREQFLCYSNTDALDFQETLLCMQASDTCKSNCNTRNVPTMKPTTKRISKLGKILNICFTECERKQTACLGAENPDPVICAQASNLCQKKCNGADTMLKLASTFESDTRKEKDPSLKADEIMTEETGQSPTTPTTTMVFESVTDEQKDAVEKEEGSTTEAPRPSTPTSRQGGGSSLLQQCFEECKTAERICWDNEDNFEGLSYICLQALHFCKEDCKMAF